MVKTGDIFVHKDSGKWYAAVEDEIPTVAGTKVIIFRPIEIKK